MNNTKSRFPDLRLFLIGLYIGLVFVFLAVWLSGPCRDCFLNYYSGVYCAIPFVGGLLGFLRVRTSRPVEGSSDRLIVMLFSTGILSFSVGLAVWVYYNFFLDVEIPYPSLADVFFVPYQLCWMLGIFILYWDFATDVVQELAAFGPMLLAAWGLTFTIMLSAHGGVLSANSPADELLKFVLDIGYPMVDALNIAMLTALLINKSIRKSSRKLRTPLVIILLGIGLNFASDLLFNATTSLPKTHTFSYVNGGIVDFLYATSTCILGIGILMMPLGISYKSRITQRLEPPSV